MNQNLLEESRKFIRSQSDSLAILAETIDKTFEQAVYKIAETKGRIFLSGMGKSGHIARKISSTFSSTGTPSNFIHPAESSHGDLGMITIDDLIIILSNSGETQELSDLIFYCKKHEITIIGIAKNQTSTLAKSADIFLPIPSVSEACPLGLAPTTSTTTSLVLGDCLASSVMKVRGFTREGFRKFHPGGKLGAKLLLIKNIMKHPPNLPLVNLDTPMSTALLEMSRRNFGIVGILDDNNDLAGVITDGDLRRNIIDIVDKNVSEVMTTKPKSIQPDSFAEEAINCINENKVTSLFVTQNQKVVGLIHILDLIKAGV